MKLYLLTTKGVGDYYVVAENSFEAEQKLTEKLNSEDYGFTNDRVVLNIAFKAEEGGDIIKISKDKNLIL